MTQQVTSQIPVVVKPLTLVENMMSQLNRVNTARTFEVLFWEKM